MTPAAHCPVRMLCSGLKQVWACPQQYPILGTLAVTSHSVTSITSLPCIWGGPDKGKHGCSAPPLLVACWGPGPASARQGDKARSCRWPSPGVPQKSFLETWRLAPVTSLSTCAPLATPAHFLASVAAVKSPSLATPAAADPLGCPSDLCRKEGASSLVSSIEGKSSRTLSTHGKLAVGANWPGDGTGMHSCSSGSGTLRAVSVHCVSALPGIAVTVTIPALPGTWPS